MRTSVTEALPWVEQGYLLRGEGPPAALALEPWPGEEGGGEGARAILPVAHPPQSKLNAVAKRLNQRPPKTLKFKTPAEILESTLQ